MGWRIAGLLGAGVVILGICVLVKFAILPGGQPAPVPPGQPASNPMAGRSADLRPAVRISGDPDLTPAAYMQRANVVARLRLSDEADLARFPAESAGSQPAPGGPYILADVDCEFEISYQKAITPREEFGIAFPVFEKNGYAFTITRFEVQTDGQKCNDIKPLDVDIVDLSGRSVVYGGCQWASPPPDGELQRIKVSYSMLLPIDDNSAKFMYVVRSGGMWAKPIGQETVMVQASAPLRLRSSGKFKPASREDGRWTWLLKNIRPTDDVEVLIDVPPDTTRGVRQ